MSFGVIVLLIGIAWCVCLLYFDRRIISQYVSSTSETAIAAATIAVGVGLLISEQQDSESQTLYTAILVTPEMQDNLKLHYTGYDSRGFDVTAQQTSSSAIATSSSSGSPTFQFDIHTSLPYLKPKANKYRKYCAEQNFRMYLFPADLL